MTGDHTFQPADIATVLTRVDRANVESECAVLRHKGHLIDMVSQPSEIDGMVLIVSLVAREQR